jgi:hypothetical protein
MKKAKSTKVTPLSNKPDYLDALSHAQQMPKEKSKAKEKKPKPNFSTENFVNVEDGEPLKKPVASLYIEVFQTKKDTCEITIKGMGEKKIMVESLSKAMLKNDGYFELFMEAAALAMIEKAESEVKKKKKKDTASTKKKATKAKVTKKAAPKKK